MQQLFRVVPLVKRSSGVETFVALQANEFRAECLCQRLCDLRFTDSGGTFDQQWLTERHRQIKRGGDRRIGDVDLLFQQPLDLSHFFSQFDLLAAVIRSKSSAVLMSSGKGRSNCTSWITAAFASTSFHAALSPCNAASCSNIGCAKIIGWPLRPLYEQSEINEPVRRHSSARRSITSGTIPGRSPRMIMI